MISPSKRARTALFLLMVTLTLFHSSRLLAAGTYLDFEEFPLTKGSVPGNSRNWLYSSSVTNDYGITESKSCGWRSRTVLPDGIHWFFEINRYNVCYNHRYGDTYGYLDITDKGHNGKALRDVITGGRITTDVSGPCPNPPSGGQLYNKESYTGPEQLYTGGKIGSSYLLFKRITKIGGQRVTSPYRIASNSNRMSMYVYLPPETSNGVGGYGKPVTTTYQAGLFVNPASTGSHHYMNFYTRGGGWTKIQIEEITNGDNARNRATRYIPNLLQSLWQFYFTTLPTQGIATPPYEVLIDDLVFERDDYKPQNNQTISNVAVLYRDKDKTFEISFNDKYKDSPDSHATCEVRYSFSPITNENWSGATPVRILPDSRFSIKARNDGRFQKWTSYYQAMWAPFTLAATDIPKLTRGRTIYFAIKDISQVGGNGRVPVDGSNGVWKARRGGRAYDTNVKTFRYDEDQPELLYIKRISYTI